MAKVQKKAKTIVELASNAGDFSTLVTALKAADLVDTLKGSGPFTVFAPTDEAFDRLPSDLRDSLMEAENKERLQQILQHHVMEGRKRSRTVRSAPSLKMLDGTSVQVQKKGDKVQIGDATIQDTDLEAENGLVHVIDRVLMPE